MFCTRLPVGAISLVGAVLLLLFPGSGPGGQGPKDELPKVITWKLAQLNQDPLRIVTTEVDGGGRVILWTLELTRDLDAVEDFVYWLPAYRYQKRPLIRFEFQNANGIVLKTEDCRYFGEYVTHKGKRFGVVLAIPDEALPATKTVEAVIR